LTPPRVLRVAHPGARPATRSRYVARAPRDAEIARIACWQSRIFWRMIARVARIGCFGHVDC
jgi:hypothetical protein